jgi:hypothetical protein
MFISKTEMITVEGERLFYVRFSDPKVGVANLHGLRWPSTIEELALTEENFLILVLHVWDAHRPAWDRSGGEEQVAAAGAD